MLTPDGGSRSKDFADAEEVRQPVQLNQAAGLRIQGTRKACTYSCQSVVARWCNAARHCLRARGRRHLSSAILLVREERQLDRSERTRGLLRRRNRWWTCDGDMAASG